MVERLLDKSTRRNNILQRYNKELPAMAISVRISQAHSSRALLRLARPQAGDSQLLASQQFIEKHFLLKQANKLKIPQYCTKTSCLYLLSKIKEEKMCLLILLMLLLMNIFQG